MNEQNKSTLSINRKALYALVPNAGIVVSLLAMNKPGPALLFIVGIVGGIIIGRYSVSK